MKASSSARPTPRPLPSAAPSCAMTWPMWRTLMRASRSQVDRADQAIAALEGAEREVPPSAARARGAAGSSAALALRFGSASEVKASGCAQRMRRAGPCRPRGPARQSRTRSARHRRCSWRQFGQRVGVEERPRVGEAHLDAAVLRRPAVDLAAAALREATRLSSSSPSAGRTPDGCALRAVFVARGVRRSRRPRLQRRGEPHDQVVGKSGVSQGTRHEPAASRSAPARTRKPASGPAKSRQRVGPAPARRSDS